MLIFDVDSTCVGVYRFQGAKEKLSTRKTYFCGLPQVVHEYLAEPEHHLLLPESAYMFHTMKMEYASHEPLTIKIYKELLQEKKEALVAEYGCDPAYMEIVPYCAGEYGAGAIKHILGKSGAFAWMWHMYVISAEMLLVLRQAYGRLLPTVSCTPRTLPTIRLFERLVDRHTFSLCIIGDQNVTMCHVHDGWYEAFGSAPLGLHILLEATEDQGVQKYLFREYSELQRNMVAQKLLLEAVGFYASALADRAAPFISTGNPLILCCSLLTHPLFSEAVQAALQMKGAFVLPFSAMPHAHEYLAAGKSDFIVGSYLPL